MADSAIFRQDGARRLLKALKDGKIEAVLPTVSFDQGVIYQQISDVTGLNSEELRPILDKLCSLGILIPNVFDNLAVCPVCNSHRLMMQLRCPTCGSPKLLRRLVIEHMSCGHIDVNENFVKGDRLICPKCGKVLRAIGVDYRKPGILYLCSDCRGFFPTPTKSYMCDGGHAFEEQDLAIIEIIAYKLNTAKRMLLERELVDFESALRALADNGWLVEVPSKIKGKSGLEHEFSCAIWTREASSKKEVPEIVIDVSQNEEAVDTIPVLVLQAKAIDVGPKETVLIAIPKLAVDGKLLAESYRIHVVEADTSTALEKSIKKLISNIAQRWKADTQV